MANSASKFILIYITAPTKSEATRLLKTLIEKRIVACGNISKIESFYWWKGKIANSTEWAIIGKTPESNFRKAKKEIEKMHSYEIPCVIKISASANKKYFDWVKRELKTN